MSTTTSAASLTAAPGRLPADVLGQVDGYLAVGIDPDRATIFAHSQIEPLNQLLVPLLSQGPQRPASAGPCSRRRRSERFSARRSAARLPGLPTPLPGPGPRHRREGGCGARAGRHVRAVSPWRHLVSHA
jgi:hypothetical protein